MPHQFRFVASDNYQPRSNADVPQIDAFFKTIKPPNRLVRSSQKHLGTELHVLERVYYKGKNQHGPSLFWRSVVSMRRMASRIYEVNLPNLLEIVAGMFHEETFGGTKKFSGAWTRIPPPENVVKILERLIEVTTLLESAKGYFVKAYRAFCLFMPATAFLQLTTVLVGMVSRISALASKMLDSLVLIVPCVYAVFEALEPPASLHRRASKLIRVATNTPTTVPEESTTKAAPNATILMDIDNEDIGLTIARTTQPATTRTIPTDMIHPTSPPIIIADSRSTTPDIAPKISPRSPSPPKVTDENIPVGPAAKFEPTPRSESITTKKSKKRRKIRDEIDDIFG